MTGSPRTIGIVLLAISGIAFIVVFSRLAWLIRTYSIGFDLFGLARMWGGWIVLWLLTIGTGLFLLTRRTSR